MLKAHKYILLIGALSAAANISALDAAHYVNSSVLSSGHWVKIRVEESGIQQITHDQLHQWGFDDPSAVTVYGFGGAAGATEILDESVPDDLPQQPVVHHDNRLLFYGEANFRPNLVHSDSKPVTVTACPGIERNNVADAGYYFITDSRPTQHIEQIPYSLDKSLPARQYHWDVAIVEEEVTNPARQGQLYFGRDISQVTDTITYTFPIRDIYFENPTSQYARVILHNILVGSGTNLSFTITCPHYGKIVDQIIYVNSSNLQTLISTNATSTNSYMALSMPQDASSFYVKLSKSPTSSFTYAAVDRLAFAYQRHNNFGDNASMLLLDNDIKEGQKVEIAQANPNIMVWNVDNGYNVRPYEVIYNSAKQTTSFTTSSTYRINEHTDKAHRAIAFDITKQHHSVDYAGEVSNQDIHSNEAPDLVILSADAFTQQAERLAQIHRELLGQDVIVLTQEEIFNEFSSGTPSLWGIRKAMKMFYDRNPAKMKHLLLFGGAFYDNRGLTTTGASFKERGVLLLNYGTPNHFTMSSQTTAYSCDAYFGMLCDAPPTTEFINNIQHINVGRIPVTDETQASQAVDKVRQYLTYSPSSDIYQRVLLIADHGDELCHMTSGEITGNSFTTNNPGITLIKGYSGLYSLDKGMATPAKKAIMQALKKGVMYVNYTGHGKPDYIGSANLYNLSDVHNTTYEYFPFAMLTTCRTYTFDRLEQSLAQDMVLQNNGGMIGVVAACREVYQTRNEILSEKIAEVFAKSPKGTTTGDILRLSRNALLIDSISGDRDLMINTSCYNLCGDPAIPLYFAGHKAIIDSVNNMPYNAAESNHIITPLTSNTITGYIEDPENQGAPWTSFNGRVILSMYESAIERNLITLGTGDTSKSIHTDEDLLVETIAKVVEGKFTINFTPPMPSRTGSYNRTTITAVLPDNSEVATTYTTALTCDPASAPDKPADTTAPDISELYINTPDFVSGDMTTKNITVYATVTDNESGIYNPTGAIGNMCRLTIDNTMNYPIVGTAITNNGDGTINITYNFTSLNDGRHTLTLHISDNAGNSATRSIDFIIYDSASTAQLYVEEEPAHTHATIMLQHKFSDEPAVHLFIEDVNGNTIYSMDNATFPLEWNLTDNNGNLVSDGVYRAYAICKTNSTHGYTPKTDIIVVQQP